MIKLIIKNHPRFYTFLVSFPLSITIIIIIFLQPPPQVELILSIVLHYTLTIVLTFTSYGAPHISIILITWLRIIEISTQNLPPPFFIFPSHTLLYIYSIPSLPYSSIFHQPIIPFLSHFKQLKIDSAIIAHLNIAVAITVTFDFVKHAH